MAEYRLSHHAARDLSDIFIYGAESFGLKQAEAYAAGMKKQFEVLVEHPLLFRAVDEIRPGYRRSVYGVHAIYYQIVDGDILIVRILRGQNPHSLLA